MGEERKQRQEQGDGRGAEARGVEQGPEQRVPGEGGDRAAPPGEWGPQAPPFAQGRSAAGVPAGAPGPTGVREREPVLDVLRGFALLGILLINIELMRGADLYRLIGGDVVEVAGLDRVVHFLTGWLAAGKFISSFAIMFGIGAALIAGKLWRAGRSPRGLLGRRYAFLLVLGLAHMVLLFPGDILFLYGVAGMLLLAFVGVRTKTVLAWAGGILGVLLVLGLGFTALMGLMPEPPADDPAAATTEDFFAEREGATVAAHAWEAFLIQTTSLILVPWIVALFLLGYAVGQSGLVHNLEATRRRLRATMLVALPLGLLLNLPTGFLGPLSLGAGLQPGTEFDLVVFLSMGGQIVGAPILAVGYLCAVALLSLRLGVLRPLAAVGRMALTAYLLQSVLALVVFAGFGLYDRLGAAQAMLVVFGVWAVLLVVCPLWLRYFRFGPLEWLWRTWTYGERQPIRQA